MSICTRDGTNGCICTLSFEKEGPDRCLYVGAAGRYLAYWPITFTWELGRFDGLHGRVGN